MEIREALTIVRKLADGVHPETGEVLQSDCLYNRNYRNLRISDPQHPDSAVPDGHSLSCVISSNFTIQILRNALRQRRRFQSLPARSLQSHWTTFWEANECAISQKVQLPVWVPEKWEASW